VFVYTDVAAGGSTGRRLPEPDDRGRHAISRAPHGQNRTVDRPLSLVIEEEAPDAWLLNETNPMAMVVMALSRATSVRRVGLCHDAENPQANWRSTSYPWFLHPGGNAEGLGIRGREYLAILDRQEERFAENRRSLADVGPRAEKSTPQSVEYAPRIVAALESNIPFTFMGNVANTGHLIENLPENCCVEVPCTVRGGRSSRGEWACCQRPVPR
jgi:alpha-galactosidase/6-phospho-beta-glucosidase family protein